MAEDPAALFDRLVESSRLLVNTQTSAPPSGLARLLIRHKPAPYFFPWKRRDLARIDPALRAAMRRCILAEAPWPLFIHGAAGTGKTCALLCLLDYAGGWYYTANGLAEAVIGAQKGELYDGANQRKETTFSLWDKLAKARLVVLDELGSRETVSAHHYDQVKRLLDERDGKPLAVLSNEGLERLSAVYDDRVASRLAAGTVVQLDGEDRRLRHG